MKRPEVKTLKDLEGWISMGSMSGLFPGSSYTVLMSPDKTKMAQVDLRDDEVVMIFNREEKKIEYVHPVTELGMRIVGVTKEQMEAAWGGANEGLSSLWRCWKNP